MNTRSTAILLVLAAGLFAFILFFDHRPRHVGDATHGPILPQLKPASIVTVQVKPAGQPEITLQRQTDGWRVARPVAAPAQAAAVENLLQIFAQLPWHSRLTEADLTEHADPTREFGFAPPQFAFDLQQAGEHLKIFLGSRTPLGDELFLRVYDRKEIYIVDSALLKFVPPALNDWRDSSLASLKNLAFNRIVVTNGQKSFEFQRDATNHVWRVIKPIDARADSAKIDDLLARLQGLRVSRFVTDDPKADLDAFGLQPPALTLALAQDTNDMLALQFGKNPTNSTTQVFVRRSDQNGVALIDTDALAPWRGAYEEFRDRHLLDLTANAPAEIEVHGPENFTLRLQSNATWRVTAPDDLPVDASLMRDFLGSLAGLQATQFVKTVVTEPDLPNYRLAPPAARFILKSADTNLAPVQLDFSTPESGKVFARRADETCVYALPADTLKRLPDAGWKLRERHIWNFSETNVAKFTLRQDGKTRELLRSGTNDWAFAPGSQGIINNFAVEEIVHRLGSLTASAWLARGETNLATAGITPAALQIALDVKHADKTTTFTLQFGSTGENQFFRAATVLDGDTWIFELPPQLGELIHLYLANPASP